MKTSPVTHQDLRRSVIAVPPLARRADLSLNEAANRALLAHLEAGGVRSVMYGGNANFYNVGWASTRASWICWPRWQAPTPGSCRRRGRTTAR